MTGDGTYEIRWQPMQSEQLAHWKKRAEDAEARLAKACAALGFGVIEKRTRDGVEVRVAPDAYYNLSGALEDLTNSNGNDEVTRNTIDRVCSQIAAARTALMPQDDTENKTDSLPNSQQPVEDKAG